MFKHVAASTMLGKIEKKTSKWPRVPGEDENLRILILGPRMASAVTFF